MKDRESFNNMTNKSYIISFWKETCILDIILFFLVPMQHSQELNKIQLHYRWHLNRVQLLKKTHKTQNNKVYKCTVHYREGTHYKKSMKVRINITAYDSQKGLEKPCAGSLSLPSPSPRTNHFFKEPWFHLLEDSIWKQRSDARCAHCC